ncbi:MAG: DUF1330 domain-containing protein [Pseudomonadota bacterium]
MTHYSVLEVTPTDDTWVADYLPAANALVKKHGGRYLARTTAHERIEGEGQQVALRIIIEWPDANSAKAFMADPDYIRHLAARTAGSESHHALIEGKDDLA